MIEFEVSFSESNTSFDAELNAQNMDVTPQLGQIIKGDDGFSPICQVRRNSADNGVKITIQDADSTESAEVFDGAGSEDEALTTEEIDELLGW